MIGIQVFVILWNIWVRQRKDDSFNCTQLNDRIVQCTSCKEEEIAR